MPTVKARRCCGCLLPIWPATLSAVDTSRKQSLPNWVAKGGRWLVPEMAQGGAKDIANAEERLPRLKDVLKG